MVRACRIGSEDAEVTNEEMQRAMDFILGQQAQSSAKIDTLSVKIDALADAQLRTDEGIRSLLAIAQMHEQEISALGQLIGSVSRDVASLGETTKATDERLNALINVVERQISNGRNGK
jgi:hypothetical protein